MTRSAPLRLLPRTPPSPPSPDDLLAELEHHPGMALVCARPPYHAPPRPLPAWARRLRHLRPLKLLE